MNITKTNLGHATGTCYAHRPAHGTQKQVRRPVVFFSQSLQSRRQPRRKFMGGISTDYQWPTLGRPYRAHL